MLDPVRWITFEGAVLSAPPAAGVNPFPGKLRLIDQTKLPSELVYVETDDIEEVSDFIRRLVVRGAPAIGCAAALGLAAVAQHSVASSSSEFIGGVEVAAERIAVSRPTAVNLFWALDRCLAALKSKTDAPVDELKIVLLREALSIVDEDIAMCRAIGEHGAELLRDGMGVLTHCNAGALATSGLGTALAPVYTATENGLNIRVFSDETRPLLQGSRLTAWELMNAGVDVVVICDSMAAAVMREGKVDVVIVGADRIAANGDTANKIGTYGLAVLARRHGIPFHVAAPVSTFDISIPDGNGIPIEERVSDEIVRGFGIPTAPVGVGVYNPAFDVTPADLVTSFITDVGLVDPPYPEKLSEVTGH